MWILRIKSKSAFVSFTVCSFFGKGFGQIILTCGMVHSRCHTCITFYLNLCWWRLDFGLLVTYHSTFVIYLHSYTVFKPLDIMFFQTYVVSAPRCILFEKRLRFKPKYIRFLYSYVVYVTFPSCLRRQGSVCCFSKSSVFSTRGARGHGVVMVTNDPFSDHFRFFFW